MATNPGIGPVRTIVVVGSAAVGKSALVVRLTRDTFRDRYDPTLEDVYSHNVRLPDGRVQPLRLIDTAGARGSLTSLHDQYYADADGFVIVLAADRLSSFAEAEQLHADITRMRGDGFPCVLLCNKVDLPDAEMTVSRADGAALAQKLGHCSFFSTSAKTGHGVRDGFMDIARQVRDAQPRAAAAAAHSSKKTVPPKMGKLKVVVFGGAAVGKSSTVVRFLQGKFSQVYDPTIQDAYCKIIEYGEDKVELDVIDTAGSDDLRDGLMAESDAAFLLVYSITSASSFQELEEICKRLELVRESQYSVVFCGNKCDMVAERQVSTDEGRALAHRFGDSPFFETSAKDNININEAFLELIGLCENRVFKKAAQEKHSCMCM